MACCSLSSTTTRSAGLEAAENNHVNITIKRLFTSAAPRNDNLPYGAEIKIGVDRVATTVMWEDEG